MAQIRQVEAQIEIKCDADKFFDVWARKTDHSFSQMCPNKIPKVELLEGDHCHAPGALMTWEFVSPLDGRRQYVKTKVEEIDEERRSVTYSIIDGDMIRMYYKKFIDKIEIVPKSNNEGSIVKWTILECEQKSQDAPDMKPYFDFVLSCVKDIDCHLSSA